MIIYIINIGELTNDYHIAMQKMHIFWCRCFGSRHVFDWFWRTQSLSRGRVCVSKMERMKSEAEDSADKKDVIINAIRNSDDYVW